MPFDPEFDAVYTDLIVPALAKAGLSVQRADNVDDRQNVLIDVVRGIADADLVIADLTTANANVFYELGLSHAIGVPTILIAHRDAAADIPFDLRQYRTEFYDTHFQRAERIMEVLERLARAHADGTLSFSSPISDFLPGATKPMMLAQRSAESTQTDGADASRALQHANYAVDTPDVAAADNPVPVIGGDDRGLVDFLDELSLASDELVAALTPINDAIERVGDEVTAVAARMDALDSASPGADAAARKLLLQAAQHLDTFADALERRQSPFEESVDKVTSSGLGYMTLLAGHPEHFGDQLSDALETAKGLHQSATGARDGTVALRDSIADLPPMIKQTNRARNRAVRALDAMLNQIDRVLSYTEQLMGLARGGLDEPDVG